MLKDKCVIVTGGASGVGRAACTLFSTLGAKIIVADVNEKGGEETAAMVTAAKGIAHFIRTDVSNEADVKAMVGFAVEKLGRLDGAFNNAGIAQTATVLHELTHDTWKRALDINLTGPFFCIKHQVLAMMKTGGGSIVNTSSTLGQVAIPRGSEYCASKHGLIGLTKAAALDYASQKIRINAVLPGAIQTPMIEMAVRNDPGLKEFVKTVHPLGRFGQPEEVAAGAAWLLSDAASFVTGTSLNVDGGYVIH